MFYRKSVVAAVAAISLGFGTACTVVHAQDAQDASQQKQNQDKSPAATTDRPDKNQTAGTTADASAPDAQQKMAMQEKMKADLKTNFNDADFVKVASMANEDEIEEAQAAIGQSTNTDVLDFAKKMITDHTQAGTELKQLAESKGWTVSDHPDVKHEMDIQRMEKMNNTDFNKAYASEAVADHQDAVALFTLAADKASDADLKAFVNKVLPTFKMHLQMAQDLEGKVSAVSMAK